MPNLPPCAPGGKYQLMFWTVEADPAVPPEMSKKELAAVFRDTDAIDKCHVSREVSETGYHHHHVVVKFVKALRWQALAKQIQKRMHYKKPGGKLVSVRAFHPRRGSDEDYPKLLSYITDKKFKDANPDPDGPLEVKAPPCPWCGTCPCDKAILCKCSTCRGLSLMTQFYGDDRAVKGVGLFRCPMARPRFHSL